MPMLKASNPKIPRNPYHDMFGNQYEVTHSENVNSQGI